MDRVRPTGSEIAATLDHHCEAHESAYFRQHFSCTSAGATAMEK